MAATTGFVFRIPRHCPACRTDRIRLGQTIEGPIVYLTWQCSECSHEWPISPDEQRDRRVGERRVMMRKGVPDKDRRMA